MPAVETFKRRDQVSDEIVLGVLDVVENDPAVTQRSVANELGIALGLANAYLKRCVRKGLIKVGQVPTRRYAYFLTPQGFAEKSRLTFEYMSHSFALFRRAKADCSAALERARARGARMCESLDVAVQPGAGIQPCPLRRIGTSPGAMKPIVPSTSA